MQGNQAGTASLWVVRCKGQRMDVTIRLGQKRKSTQEMDDLDGQPPCKHPRLDEMVWLRRKRESTQEVDDLHGQSPCKVSKDG